MLKTSGAVAVLSFLAFLNPSSSGMSGLDECGKLFRDPAQYHLTETSHLHPDEEEGIGRPDESCDPSPYKESYSIEELQEDFRQFRRHIEETHPCPYRFTSRESFDRLFRTQYEKIKTPMSLRDFYCLLAPLKAQIGCGHAHLDYPAEYRQTVQNHKFPLILRFIGNRCYLKKDLNRDSPLLPYCEILSIDGLGIESIADTLRSEISADGHNRFFKASSLEYCFQYYYANHYGAPKEFRIEYRTDENGEKQEARIPAVPCSGINFSNKEPKNLEIQVIPGKKAALLTIDSFIYYEEKNRIFFEFIDRAFSRIKEEKIGNVILDLRGNGGGDPFCAGYLWAFIEREPHPYFSEPYGKYAELSKPVSLAENCFSGNLFVLIDGSNFSTTGHFCSLLKYHGRGTFIGTETGGTYTCNAAVKVFPLKNTELGLKIATGSYAAAVEGLPGDRGIVPHYSVRMSVSDMKNGIDTVLEYALKLIENVDQAGGPDQKKESSTLTAVCAR